MTDQKEFELSEDEFQKAFDEIKLPFSPTVLLTINLLRCRNVSVNFFQDLIDIPDPQFRVSIPSLPECGRFVTLTIEDDSPTTTINESFSFVLPKDLNPNDELIIQIELYDRDIIYDDYIGTKTINAAKLNLGESILKTLDFNNHGELDLEVSKMMRSSPDFRYSLGLNPKEKTYRKKRLPHVYNALLETLGNKRGPQTIAETPVVSIVGSGGGYRAATGMSGALEALKDAGLLDVVTYLCGLSGSMWYLSTAYAMEGISSCKQSYFHERLRKRFSKPVMNGLFNPRKIHQFEHYLKHTKLKHQQPYSFTDFFPGYLMGRVLLGKQNMDFKLSNIEPYVRDGDLPLPLFSALHVKSKVEAFRFHVFVESSPFEVAFPELGIGIPPEDFGSLWNQGFLINKRPEIPLHYCQAMHGCAFSILLSSFFERGGEGDELKQCDHVRVNERKSTKRKPPVEIDSDVSEDSDAEREAIRAAKAALKKPVTNNPATSGLSRFVTNIAIPTLTEPREVFRRHAQSSSSSKTNATNSQKERRRSPKRSPIKSLTGSPKGSPKESPKNSPSRNRRPQKKTTEMLTEQAPSETLHTISNKLRSLSLLTNRQALIGRTGRMLNIAKGCNFLKRFSLNPCGQIQLRDYRRQQAVSSLRQRDMHVISTTKDVISIADAGIYKNVPIELALRPQRMSDLVIVLDFNAYQSDSEFDYEPLVASAAQAWRDGLKFPFEDFAKLKNSPPKEFLLLASDDDDCPTILWFTLNNKKFRNLENYVPRSTEKPSKKDAHKKFNDFPVFDQGTAFGSFIFQYEPYHFAQLQELMYYNVSLHIEEIKDELAKAVERKRQRLTKKFAKIP